MSPVQVLGPTIIPPLHTLVIINTLLEIDYFLNVIFKREMREHF